MSTPWNVAIIGSGPAGWTSAVYTARANLKPIVFAGVPWGGQLMITTDVENYPGFPKGITGPELMAEMRKQGERFDTVVKDEQVNRVDFSQRPFRLEADGGTHFAHTVIISTGASAKWLGLPSEQQFMGKGVSGCATCDGFFFKNKPVAVVGGGDTAAEEANYLTKMCSKVFLIHRRHELRASKIMADRVLNNPKIEMVWESAIDMITGSDVVTGVNLRHLKSNAITPLSVDGVFVAIGHQPNTKIFEGQITLNPTGYVVTDGRTRTNVPGVFAGGDVQDSIYRQAITAAGTGCMAAMEAQWFLEHGSAQDQNGGNQSHVTTHAG